MKRARRRPRVRAPELVGIAVDNPIGVELIDGASSHLRHPPALRVIVPWLKHILQDAGARVLFRDARRTVYRTIVHEDDLVDASSKMELEVLSENILLVPYEERHDQFHSGLIRGPPAITQCAYADGQARSSERRRSKAAEESPVSRQNEPYERHRCGCGGDPAARWARTLPVAIHDQSIGRQQRGTLPVNAGLPHLDDNLAFRTTAFDVGQGVFG